jgi:anti-anti-sigma factor
MEITEKKQGGITVVSPSGSIDAVTAPELGRYVDDLIGRGDVRLVVDLEQVDYTSSAGLRVLLGAAKGTRAEGGDVRLAAVRADVLKVLSLSGFTSILKIYDDVDAAVASFT